MSASGQARVGRPRQLRATSVERLLGTTIGLLLVLGVVGIGLALLANGQLTSKRQLLLDGITPALRAGLELEDALVNEETGVRGYIITGDTSFLAPYDSGRKDEARAYAELDAHERTIGPSVTAEVRQVRGRAKAWRRQFVAPALARPHSGAGSSIAPYLKGKALFNSIRTSLRRLQSALEGKQSHTHRQLERAASTLELLLIVAAVLILGGIVGAGFILRRTITRPLARLGAEARRVAAGEFETPLRVASGPLEVASVGQEIDAMRERIVAELATVRSARVQLEEQSRELQRSNSELEQFAYVASHDLQEPLRKVASFCQALQSRYRGQLDDRADQYIDFAVDGAKRMQTLINDLLAFSRVGRSGREHELVPLAEPLAAAEAALGASLEAVGAHMVAGELPTVLGDRALLGSLFQNLLSNAVKFRGPTPLVVRIEARLQEGEWQLCCADNGIGVEPEHAERIFLIFQRLHSRDSYDGSGIGLALCRKIVEYHGGRIWLDTDSPDGACFRFTLPVADGPAQDAGQEERLSLQETRGVEARDGQGPAGFAGEARA